MISGEDIHRLYAGRFEKTNVPIEMIEDYIRLNPLLKPDWNRFEELMREETRKSKLYSVYNKTIKDSQTISSHPTDQILDLIKQSSAIQATVDEPYKYQPDQPLNARIQLIINDKLQSAKSIDKNSKYYILLDRTPFYSTSGGQASDRGTLQFSNDLVFQVE